MNISIFGGSKCTQEEYDMAYKFVKEKLNDSNINIITGGTIGTMDAICKAGKENKNKVIGITLKKWKQYINEYNDEVISFSNEMDRMKYVCENSDIFIVLDGDVGTKEELMIVMLLSDELNKDIYIVGEKTKELLEYMFKNNHISEDYRKQIKYSSFEEFNI